ncbi:MAG TPA: hypothetical protein VFQ86_11445 [Arachidicoccus soli]|uniref:type IV toxin-antitoxin system AbiEi family antitoxin domain-containing protein n=1 Tax=Arachidicoccus soli TaxID=2341117 RepID=UPI001968B252|nr:hypothetical protein [Arachidicoccus soli]HEU0228347.1 hypothetical protein [Arachidicoccus soli]
MDIIESITKFGTRPIPHQVLITILKEYKRPNDKINEWVKQDMLITLKKGLYIWKGKGNLLAEPFIVANALYGPSYISGETALAYHNLTPERVFGYMSMTTRKTKIFNNRVGNFEFRHLPLPYYSFGTKQEEITNNQFAIIATGEKALFDKIVTTPGILIRSKDVASSYLLENLRIDKYLLKQLDIKTMKSWIADAPKKETLSFIIKAIQSL